MAAAPQERHICGRAGVVNLFDRHPPALPETYQGIGLGASQYDNRGRFFFVGANLQF